MAAYDTLRAAIDSYIKANGNNEITGTVLNDILNAMVSALGADTRFAGVAVPSTNPGNPEGNVVYFASQAGTYSNFGGIVLPLGIHILVWNGTAWTSQTWFSVNNTPTQNSQNLVTSGGIFQAIVDAVGVERLRAIGVEVTSASFNSTTKKISFFNSANSTLFQLDATAFIIDGMVSDVKIENGNLVIKFNTDSGKQDIEIPLTDIFNPANYYTKTAIDTLLTLYYTKTETNALLTAINNKLADGCLYRGMAEPTTNPPTPTTKVFYIATKTGTYTNFGNISVTEGITILKYDGSNWSKEQISYSDGVFDISAYNGTSYADLSAALGSNGANIPQNLRKGGMSIKFVQSSDNNYVQYFLTKNEWSASEADWEKVNLEEEVQVLNNKIGTNSGIVCEGTYTKLDKLFTNDNVNVGDILYIEATNNGPFVTFYTESGTEMWHMTGYTATKEVPANFGYALLDYGATGEQNTVKITNLSMTNYRVTKLEEDSNIVHRDIDSINTEIGASDGVLASGTYTKLSLLFTEADVNVGDEIEIKRLSGENSVAFLDKNNQELAVSVGNLSKVVVPSGFAKAIVDYDVSGSKSTFIIRDKSQVNSRITDLESFSVKETDYGVISAKVELPSDAHDENELCEIMSISPKGITDKSFKFMLKKAQTGIYENAIGVCPVPVYNAGIIAGYAYKNVEWHDGYGLSWQDGYIGHTQDFANEKCSLKMLVTFRSITVNTAGTDVRICWYFGEEIYSNIQWTRYPSAMVDEVINVPTGAKYFAISTQITDTNASVEFDTYAMYSDSPRLTPDGWNKSLLLGNDTIALRFSGDVTTSANQDIRLKIDDTAVTIYHGTDDSVIASFAKSSYNTAEELYGGLQALTDFSVEMLDISGVVFDDFIKCDVALVSQYNVRHQDAPSVEVTEWDAFPFYFTTKEKGGVYNFEIGIDSSDTNGKKLQAVVNGYPLYSSDDVERLMNTPLSITYGEDVEVLKQNCNTKGNFYCPIRRMFFVEGMTEGNINGTGGAAWTCRAKIEEAFDIMLEHGGHSVGYEDMMNEVVGDYKTSGPQFVFTSDDNGIPLYTSPEIRNMFAKKGVRPSTFFILNNAATHITPNISTIKACLNAGYFCGVHSPMGYSDDINVGQIKYSELVDAVQQTFSKFVELFDRQPKVWDFHRDGESYNTVRYILNHGYNFIIGGGYANDYGIISTITQYRIKRFGIRPDSQGQNVRMPNDWLFRKY